jgi:hypothetical protein
MLTLNVPYKAIQQPVKQDLEHVELVLTHKIEHTEANHE